MESKLKYLELIQNIITRMANNSFKLREWTVLLATAGFAFAVKEPKFSQLFVIVMPILAFWWLDAYYLQQERLYRALYNKAVKMEEKNIDFSLKATKENFPDKSNEYLRVLSSKTEVGFYAPLLFTFIIAFCIMIFIEKG